MDAPLVHLGLSCLGALNTVNAYRPLGRRGPAAVLAYLGGWPTSELPLQTLGLQLAATALALPAGAASGPLGAAACAVSAVSWLGLLGLRRRAAEAEATLEAALVEALGPDYRERVQHPRVPAGDVATRTGLFHVLRARSRHLHQGAVHYGDDRAQLLDVWRRPDVAPDARAPVLLQVPGGAWVMGSRKGQAYPLMSHLVERGWVCVSIGYRLSPRATWPDHVVDVKRALAWVKDHIAEHGGDPDFVVVTGGSAGGHLASLVALTPGDPAFQPGFEQADTTVAAAVSYYGVYDWSDEVGTGGSVFLPHLQRTVVKRRWADDPAVFRAASPLRRVHPDAPPFLVLWGSNDTMVSPKQPRTFVPALRAVARRAVAAAELHGAQHSFDTFGSPRAAAAAAAVGRFLGVLHGEHVQRRQASPSGDASR